MSRDLKISKTLSLPDDLITDRVAILATTGAGKTYLMRVIVEEVLRIKQQVVVLDPKGDFWGLRATADDTGPGYAIPIFGGEHSDLPLEEGSGGFIAELIVKERLSAILDMSLFSKTKMLTWATDFAEQFYHRNRDAMMLAIDEAHTFAPQKFKGHERMLGAFTDLVSKGRKRGIGTLLASQRSALLNKDVLDLTATLFALRTGSSRDRDAIDAWVEYNASQEVRRQIMGDLPKMENGEAWVYSPHSFKLLERITVREAKTFDSSATPRPGQAVRKPKTLAEIDVGQVTTQMSEAIERAKAKDPKELQRRIAELERELKKRPTEEKVVEVPVEVPVPVLTDEDFKAMHDVLSQIANAAGGLESAADGLIVRLAEGPKQRPVKTAPIKSAPKSPPRKVTSNEYDSTDVTLGKGERTVLAVLAQWPDGLTQNRLAFLAGYSAKASTIGVILSKLRKAELVSPDQPIRLTEKGEAQVGGFVELPSGQELLDHWLRHPRMGEGERKVLTALIEGYPEEMTHAELCEATGYSPDASTIGVILSKLRKLGLVEKGHRRTPDEFMEAIA